eukprot:12880993-Ditylum_brightwellii.AAC.1
MPVGGAGRLGSDKDTTAPTLLPPCHNNTTPDSAAATVEEGKQVYMFDENIALSNGLTDEENDKGASFLSKESFTSCESAIPSQEVENALTVEKKDITVTDIHSSPVEQQAVEKVMADGIADYNGKDDKI